MDLIPLKLFNERASRLKESRFLEWLSKSPKEPRKKDIISGDWLAYEGLRLDDLDAFCLNLRLLIQDRDGFSINCLSKIYQELPDTMHDETVLFEKVQQDLNSYLDKRSLVQIKGRNLKNRDLFHIIFYGGIVHNDVKYHKDYNRLVKNGIISIFCFVTLWNIIIKFNTCIQTIAQLNCIIIEQIEESNL